MQLVDGCVPFAGPDHQAAVGYLGDGHAVADLLGVVGWCSRCRKIFPMPDHGFLHGADQVAPQMPSVGDLHRIRCADTDSFGVGAGPVTAHDLGTGMCLEPDGDGVARSVRQQIDRSPCDQVHDDSAVDVAAAECEVVDPEHGGRLDRPVGYRPHGPQQGVASDTHPESGGQSSAGATGHGQSDRFDHRTEHRGPPSPPLCQSWHLLGESGCSASAVVAEEPADRQLEHDRVCADCSVGGPASVPRVHPVRPRAAGRTVSAVCSRMCCDPDRRIDEADGLDDNTGQMRQQGRQGRNVTP